MTLRTLKDIGIALVWAVTSGALTYWVVRDYQWTRDGKRLAEETEQWLAQAAKR